ncbi:30292_t:CDS:2, partial [Gigaspora margarita]
LELKDIILGQYTKSDDTKPGYLDDKTILQAATVPLIRLQPYGLIMNVEKNAPYNELVIRVQPNEAVYMKNFILEKL